MFDFSHNYIFSLYYFFLLNLFFFLSLILCLQTVIWYQVYLSNTNNLLTIVGFQVFLSNTNNLFKIIWRYEHPYPPNYGYYFFFGLTTDRDLAEPLCLRKTTSFIPPWYQKSHGTNHYTTEKKLKKYQNGFWNCVVGRNG